MRGQLPVFSPWGRVVTWRGAGTVLLDLADRPQFMHKFMPRLTGARFSMLHHPEEKGLLGSE